MSTYTETNEISLHGFPKDKQYKDEWIKFCEKCIVEAQSFKV